MSTLLGRIVRASTVLLLAWGSAAAAPLFTINTGAIYAYRYITPISELRDVRGLVALDVSDPGLLGTVLLADSTGGTDPGFAVLPFGNASLIGLNSAATETTAHTFDLAAGIAGATSFTVDATGVPLAPGVTTDPALQRLLGTLTFSFSLIDFAPVPGTPDFLATYVISGVTAAAPVVPEPSTGLLVLLGAGVVGVYSRRRRK